jgi:hypothetical protein
MGGEEGKELPASWQTPLEEEADHLVSMVVPVVQPILNRSQQWQTYSTMPEGDTDSVDMVLSCLQAVGEALEEYKSR